MFENEQIREAGTCEEMRIELQRVQRYDALVHHVLDAAYYRGLSGEDTYTTLAYYALKELARYKQLVLDNLLCSATASVILKEKEA